MKSISHNILMLGVAILMICCSKEECYSPDSPSITFSTAKVPISVQTKSNDLVTQGETDFGSYVVTARDRVADATRVTNGSFESGDEIGIYLYYNYYYADNSESVILDDAKLTVGGSNIIDAHRLWTFSSVGGDVPHHLHAVAYYPKAAEADLSMTSSVPAMLSWTCDPTKDFMVACTEYDYTSDGLGIDKTNYGARFKTYIVDTKQGNVPLEFKYKRATFSFYIYKARGLGAIVINSLTLNYKFKPNYSFNTDTKEEIWNGDAVSGSTSLNVTENGTLAEKVTTGGMKAPKLGLDKEIFMPCMSEITSISFDLIVDNVSKTYTWHPHIANMQALNYQIQFELDPDRKN